MAKITSRAFFQAWVSTVENRKDHMLSIWRKSRPYTAYIKGNEESVMQEVSNKLGLLHYNEYYSIDTVLYEEDDLVPDQPEGWRWLRDIRVAFEHENFFGSGLFKEVSHLLLINCDLRVLVVYPDGEVNVELDYLHKVISGNRSSMSFSQDESFLIIFGYEDGFRWKGMIYKTDKWTLLAPV
jgi:hypothetical protein